MLPVSGGVLERGNETLRGAHGWIHRADGTLDVLKFGIPCFYLRVCRHAGRGVLVARPRSLDRFSIPQNTMSI